MPAYRGRFQGGAVIVDADGRVLARRGPLDGPGFALAEVAPGRVAPLDEVPDRFWLHRRGAVGSLLWAYQRAHGRRWYARHTAGRPPLKLERVARATGAV